MGNVAPFPGKPLVGVLFMGDRYAVMLAKLGAPAAELQCSFDKREDAEREAREGAALCGWRYVGVVESNHVQGPALRPSPEPQGPDAA